MLLVPAWTGPGEAENGLLGAVGHFARGWLDGALVKKAPGGGMAELRARTGKEPFVVREPFLRPVLQVVVGTGVAAILLPHIGSEYRWLVLLTVVLAVLTVCRGCWLLLVDKYCVAVDSRGVWIRGRYFVPWRDIRQVRSIRWSDEEGSYAAVLIALAPVHGGMLYTSPRSVLQELAVDHLFPASLISSARDSWDPGPLERVLRAALADEHFRGQLGVWTPPRFSGLAACIDTLLTQV